MWNVYCSNTRIRAASLSFGIPAQDWSNGTVAFIGLTLTGIYTGPRPAPRYNWSHSHFTTCHACACSPTKINHSFMWLHQFKVLCSAPLSWVFGSINCNQFRFDGNRTCFPSQVWLSEQHRGASGNTLSFWLSSPWASLDAHVCTLYFLCLFQFSTASRPPATDPTTSKEQKPELPCLGLQHLSVNANYI